jgi:hypothetical protein
LTDFSEVLTASIIRAIMDALSTCETPVNFYEQYIPITTTLLIDLAQRLNIDEHRF